MTVDDVLATADRIMADPNRGAIGASVIEVTALAATVLDLWDVALGAEALIASETLSQATVLAGGIAHRLADLRETTQEEANRT